MLCIGDSILSLSLTWFSLVKMSDWSATNVGMCLFQTFAVCYGLVFTYSIVFLVCYERYLVVKNYNFGVQNFFERFKVVIIGGTLSFGFIFTIETVMFVPHQKTIANCTVPLLYGKHFAFFIQFIAGGLTLIMVGIVFYSIRTSILIWKLFFTTQNIDIYHQPLEFNSKLNGSTACVDDSEETCYCKNCILEDKVKISYETESENNETNIAKDFNTQIAIKKKDQNITGILRSESNELRKQIRQLVTQWKKERVGDDAERLAVNNSLSSRRKLKPDAWEKRALLTSIIIAMSTIFLTFPFILSFWLDYIYGERFTSQKARLFLFIPLILNSIINPSIYAWRIPEIKQAIKKIFPCYK